MNKTLEGTVTIRWDNPFQHQEAFNVKTKWREYRKNGQYANTDVFGDKLFKIIEATIHELKHIGVHGCLSFSYIGHMPDYFIKQLKGRPLVQGFRIEEDSLRWEVDLDTLCFGCDHSICRICEAEKK